MNELQILETPKTPSWQERVLSWPQDGPVPVSLKSAKTVRGEISKAKKYINPKLRFKTWTDTLEGVEVLMVERLPDAEQ